MKKILYILAMAFIVGLTTNCSDDNETPEKATDINEEVEERNSLDSMSAQGVISQVYDIQVDETYKFRRGRNISSSDPNTFYCVCNDAKEAALFYNNYCTNEPIEVNYVHDGDSLVAKFDVANRKSTFGDYGYTSLSIGSGNPDYATIEFSFNAVGNVHKLVFVPASYMPDNSDYESFKKPYALGDIYKDNANNQWLCVKESQPSSDGYFVRLDNSRDEKLYVYTSISDHYKSLTYAVAKPNNTIANKDAWEGFVSILNWSQGQNALVAMKNHTNGVNMDTTCKLMKLINREWNGSEIFQVGNVSCSGKEYCSACVRHVYKVWIPYIRIYNIDYSHIIPWFIVYGYQFNTEYAKHEIDDSNIDSETLNTVVMLQLSFRNSKLDGMTKVYPKQSPR